MKMNKKAFLPRTWIIAFIIFSVVFTLLFLASQEFATDYNNSGVIDNTYRENYDKFSNVSEDYRDIFEDISDDNSGALDIIFDTVGIFQVFITTIRVTFSSILSLDDVAQNFMIDYGVPDEIAFVIFPLITALVVIVLIFSVISSLNRSNRL